MGSQVGQGLLFAVAELELFELGELTLVTSDKEKEADDCLFEEVYKSQVEDVPPCLLEHASDRDRLDSPVVLRFVLES